jgi:FHA domain
MDVRLKILRGPLAGQSIPIRRGELLIGRDPECHLRPGSAGVSRRHCVVVLNKSTLRIRDLDSKNGTYVNNRRVTNEAVLAQGDIVSVGDMVCRVELVLAPEPEVRKASPPPKRGRASDDGPPAERRRETPREAPRLPGPSDSIATGPVSWRNALKGSSAHNRMLFERRGVAPRPVTPSIRIAPRPVPRVAPARLTPPPRPVDPPSASSWRDALSSRVALKPLSAHESRPAQRADLEDDDDEPGPYQVNEKSALQQPRNRSRPAGFIKSFYRGSFRRLGWLFRWINEAAYGISILFLMLACVGFAIQVYSSLDNSSDEWRQVATGRQSETQILDDANGTHMEPPTPLAGDEAAPPTPHRPHKMRPYWVTTVGITGIVILNLVRLVAGLANLIMIPFRQSPVHGSLFLVPPLTLLYFWRHWNQVRKPVSRIISPLVTLALVVAAYAFVPGLSLAARTKGSLEHRLKNSVNVLKRDVTHQIDTSGRDAKSLERKLERRFPSEFDKVRKTANDLRGRVENAAKDFSGPDDDAQDKTKKPAPDPAKDPASNSSTRDEK